MSEEKRTEEQATVALPTTCTKTTESSVNISHCKNPTNIRACSPSPPSSSAITPVPSSSSSPHQHHSENMLMCAQLPEETAATGGEEADGPASSSSAAAEVSSSSSGVGVSHISNSSNAPMCTLWIGQLSPRMNEAGISKLIEEAGFSAKSVKLIKHKQSNESAGYGFIQFGDHATAKSALESLQGKFARSSSSSSEEESADDKKQIKLNWATPGTNLHKREFSVYIGKISRDVSDEDLVDFITEKKGFKSVTSAKIVIDSAGVSKGYAFARFSSLADQQRALRELNGATGLGKNALLVNQATPKYNRNGNGTYYSHRKSSSSSLSSASSSSRPFQSSSNSSSAQRSNSISGDGYSVGLMNNVNYNQMGFAKGKNNGTARRQSGSSSGTASKKESRSKSFSGSPSTNSGFEVVVPTSSGTEIPSPEESMGHRVHHEAPHNFSPYMQQQQQQQMNAHAWYLNQAVMYHQYYGQNERQVSSGETTPSDMDRMSIGPDGSGDSSSGVTPQRSPHPQHLNPYVQFPVSMSYHMAPHMPPQAQNVPHGYGHPQQAYMVPHPAAAFRYVPFMPNMMSAYGGPMEYPIREDTLSYGENNCQNPEGMQISETGQGENAPAPNTCAAEGSSGMVKSSIREA